MNKKLKSALVMVQAITILTLVSSRLHADTGTCGGVTTTVPFTDVGSSIFFCQIAEAYFSGLTNGTSATTYSPSDPVPREQMAAFITRTQDSALRRGSRRATLKQWMTPAALPLTGRVTTGIDPELVESDGADVWVPDSGSNDVKRVRASDGKLLETWTGATGASGVLVARGRVYVTGFTVPGNLYVLDPSTAPGAVTPLSSTLGNGPGAIATDGSFIWIANQSGGSVSRVDPDTGSTTTFLTGFSKPSGILFDGANIWMTDQGDDTLKKLDTSGAILQSVTVGSVPTFAVFDGSNIWVPNAFGNSITVVRARDGLVLATLTGNGLSHPLVAAFDGQRILVTSEAFGNNVSLWKAADLTPIGTFATGGSSIPFGACSDGIGFWISLKNGANQLARF